MLHDALRLFTESMRFVGNQGHYHLVKVEKEHDQVEAKFDE